MDDADAGDETSGFVDADGVDAGEGGSTIDVPRDAPTLDLLDWLEAWKAESPTATPMDFGEIAGGGGGGGKRRACAVGGPGSGNWYRWRGRKATVEESLAVGVKDLRGRLPGVASDDDLAAVRLCYRWRGKEDVEILVRLETTPTRFNGRRWWFVCPLIVRGVACDRRAGKLYLPPGAKYFGCRKCHDLTYRTCQEAHRSERLFARLGLDAEFPQPQERTRRGKAR